MRRLLALLLAIAPLADAAAQAPPNAWLFGTWTGGLFPAPRHVTAETCLAQPTVIFMRDIVLRATLTDVTYVQRVVATARTQGNHTDFTFAPAPPPAGAGTDTLAGLAATPAPAPGFGCATPDVLNVVRKSANEIVFPNCADFPNPLVRCPASK
ncbi:MAG TPA: hypothetical protein VFN46_01320 [Acetobacteraceae bacterium]|nr:hypothetical protein [Acetobacteraceae bacterium]